MLFPKTYVFENICFLKNICCRKKTYVSGEKNYCFIVAFSNTLVSEEANYFAPRTRSCYTIKFSRVTNPVNSALHLSLGDDLTGLKTDKDGSVVQPMVLANS